MKGGEHVLATVLAQVKAAIGRADEPPVGVGISSAGVVNPRNGDITFANELMPGWGGTHLGAEVTAATGLPCRVLNDVHAHALGEARWGGGRDKKSCLVAAVGTGIGGGIIENGRLIQGRRGIGGEIGHYIINFDGVECPCGNRGCFERYGSTGALVRRFTENVALLEKLGVPAEDVNGKVIFDHLDDADVSATVNSWIDSIAFGIIGLVHIFNPEMVLIGGGISREDEHFIRPLREKILNGAMEQFAKDLEVEAAALGNNAGLLGACAYFRQNF